MSDEDLRREQRAAAAGSPPGLRRMLELTRLASSLAAVIPTPSETERFFAVVPPGILKRLSVTTLTALRAFFREQGIHAFLRNPDPAHRYYGLPQWLSRVLEDLRREQRQPEIELHGMLFPPAPTPSIRFGRRRDRPRHFSGSTLPPARPTSDPRTSPEHSGRLLEDALRTLPAPRARRR